MKQAAALAAAAVIWASPAMARFAPVEGTTLRYSVAEERNQGVDTMRFTSERRIVFRKNANGYVAELTIVSVGATGDRDTATMARRVMSALVGRTIRYQLDGDGTVVAVEDQAGLIALVADAVGKMATTGKSGSTATRDAITAKVSAAIIAMPDAAQRAMLGSLISVVVAGAQADAVAGARDVAVPAGSAVGQAVTLPGRETVARRSDRRVTIDTIAEGAVPGGVPASAPGAELAASGTPMMRIVQHRVVDPATGLMLTDERRTETWLTDAPGKRNVTISTASLAPMP